MRSVWKVLALKALALVVVVAPSASALQDLQLASAGPRFLSTPAPGAPAVDVSDAPALQRQVTFEVDRITLEVALDRIERQTGLHIFASPQLVPLDSRVSLHADGISVGAALFELLRGTGLDVQLARDGRTLSLVPRAGTAVRARQQGAARVEGRVTDAVTRAPLDQVAVRLEGPGLGGVTTSDGRYAIRNVPPGAYHVTARRVGYTPLTKAVTVTPDSTTGVDFALTAAATKLNEVVTTAVGDQRRYEVGNVISTINADSIAPTAPITSLTDLISSRAPGVEVLEMSGMTGSGETIRIRGLSSLVLQNDPILIVDGVRQDNSAGGDVGAYFNPFTYGGGSAGTHPSPTRLNDVDFSDVESIDVLKGPSASTEYGTDAANGVIVITTKHGIAGRPQWKVSAEQTTSGIPKAFPNGLYSWGHTTDGTHTAVNCPLLAGEGISVGYARTAGNCLVDSVTQWNPLNHGATSIFGTGTRSKYDLSVSGGSEALRYFVSGGLTNERGIIQMPSVFRHLADTANLRLPSTVLNPNSEQQRSVRLNTAFRLGPTADLTATGDYLSTYQQTPDASNLYAGATTSPALRDPAHYYGYDYFGSSAYLTPLAELTALGSQNTDRVAGGLTGNWRPTGWLVGHAAVGLDHGSQRNEILNYPLANSPYALWSAFIGLSDATTNVYSVDLRGTATASLAGGVRTRTSAGLQMADRRTVGQSGSALGITSTNLTLNGATAPKVVQFADRQATLGGYGEEELSVADRLFLTGALRVDAGSSFGQAYATAAYPKASVSWLALDREGTTLRVRGAFGESGVQPLNGAALRLYALQPGYLGGGTVSTSTLNWLGNPALRPERSAEFEGGVDLTGWTNRVSLEFTGYSKTTRDALVNVNLGGSTCCYTYQQNIGKVRNTGLEGSVTVVAVQSRVLTWNLTANGSVNHNTLVSLAAGVPAQVTNAYPAQYRQAPGFPLYGMWAQRLTYADANHDGIIEASEATVADSATYIGPNMPTREASVSTRVALWRGAVTVGGVADYRGGYRLTNANAMYEDLIGNTRQTNDPSAPMWLQARAAQTAVSGGSGNALYVEDASFVRFRELSVTYTMPAAVVRALRAQSMSVTGAVRNLALWTRYTGIDPEVSTTNFINLQLSPTAGGRTLNNDVRQDYGGVPLPRSWVVRLNLGL